MTDQILFETTGDWGVITLNNEKALNALNWDMVKAMRAQLNDWSGDKSVKAVMVKGAGDRAFCAGGDIRWLHDTAKEDPAHASEFFREEYRNNSLIYHYSKPYVAMIDGIVMGGGVGISVHGDFRVAGDATLFAMPETGIGLFPDVGGGHFMPRLHDGLGLYYALTGARAKAADCMAAGIATHYAPADKYAELEAALLKTKLGDHAHADIETILDTYAGDPGHAPVNDMRPEIARLFQGHEALEDLLASLEKDGGDFASETLKTLSRMSPTSLVLTFEQMKRGHNLDFDDNMKMEFRMVCRVMEGHDFFEGVRAQILDKDRNPKWSPASLSEISESDLQRYFDDLGDPELVLP
ncbi:enoyl-CoA hydratase/isomerase family protein [Hyphococcus flavus]|uniref:3-hydroxyisobutyryl-CoA hydrolase n=1 Tax=Hyphococcus flavus TaxID=1866326 RepID=A0AAF0CGF7_9PROT|nr:enoyl-CoA hydratase/isomerase family protein [Hyphococcus flavus]WDI30612.1 enoyl-CoA hydratase/isomerase family protein [Hyphococcus flavus]